MSLEHIEIELYNDVVSITNEGTVQMYSGDRGTTVFSTVKLTPPELDQHILDLIAIQNKLRGC